MSKNGSIILKAETVPEIKKSLSTIFTKIDFPSNKVLKNQNNIQTTKYSLLTFIPLNLYSQFKRFYNLYFLLGALSVLLGFSSLSVASQIAPLLIVLTFSAAKEAIEDYNRYKQDCISNAVIVDIIKTRFKPSSRTKNQKRTSRISVGDVQAVELGGKIRTQVSSKDCKPGDIICIKKGEKAVVDMVMLSSSYEDGTIFIDTAELDGETNLKRKSAVGWRIDSITDTLVASLQGSIECELPNENLVSFTGRLLTNPDTVFSLSMLHFVPRGSVLKNTLFAYGVCIYSGVNTKIMKNLKPGIQKRSDLEKSLNNLVLFAFAYNAILLASSVIFEYFKYQRAINGEQDGVEGYQWYLGFQTPSTLTHIYGSIVSFFTLYTYVIPISLFVTIELVRLGQASYMVWDPKMIHHRHNTDQTISIVPMRANNSNLNEELARIDYIFSDKTGTFTQNSMKIDKYCVKGRIFDERENIGSILHPLNEKTFDADDTTALEMFLTALSICHNVIPAIDDSSQKTIYESQSPDETALLIGCERNEFRLLKRSKQSMTVRIIGEEKTFDVLDTIDFNSTRKRMSVLIKSDDGIRLYCKGADNIMIERLGDIDSAELAATEKALLDFSNTGLRTLVVCYKDLTIEEYTNFKSVYDAAQVSLVDRDAMIESASDLVETGLKLLGCTAIEDKLQDKVPETIENLIKAGIKIWLLTGDKQETAINIGIASRLISDQMILLKLDAADPVKCERQMDDMIRDLKPPLIYAMVVNGKVLTHIFTGTSLKSKFLQIGKSCKTVICSRVTPLQKAQVVRLVKDSSKGLITLAIGDGANDVSMIQEAHVGVGIMGREGTQAVRAADYAFGEFKFLERLLLVHGRYNNLRLTNLILYSFYKNFVFITIQWLFGFANDWSGQTVYEQLFFISFNVLFTSIPPLVYGLYERDLPDKILEDYPELYRNIKTEVWNPKVIINWFVSSLYHAIIIFGVVYYLNRDGAIDVDGKSTGYWVQCYLLSTPMLLVVLTKQAIISHFWIWYTAAGILLSIAMNVALIFGMVILDWYTYLDFQTSAILHGLPAYYLLCIILPILCIIPDLIVTQYELFISFVALIWPTDTDIMLEHCALTRQSI